MINQYKVIKNTMDVVYLGKEDGSLLTIERKYFQFLPIEGEFVEVYGTEGNYVVKQVQSRVSNATDVNDKTKRYKIVGWITIVLALLFIPIVTGTIGVIMGYLVRSRGDKEHGTIMIIVAIGMTILGMLLGTIFGSFAYA
ncbi:zinc ribbon domain-containing protein [Streptococcus sp. SS-4456]|uniref:zinc ribbon domain-containing protein n=1 Tax=Streptococcus sp. SS-4456 TaxID=3072286 RepID=UPI002FC70FA5